MLSLFSNFFVRASPSVAPFSFFPALNFTLVKGMFLPFPLSRFVLLGVSILFINRKSKLVPDQFVLVLGVFLNVFRLFFCALTSVHLRRLDQ